MADHKAAKYWASRAKYSHESIVANVATCYLELHALVLEEIEAQTGLWGPERLSPAMRKVKELLGGKDD